MIMASPLAAAEPVKLFAAGSLKAALSDVAKAFEAGEGVPVETTVAPSGLLRERIEGGEAADVFAAANLKHPQMLAGAGWGGPVALFTRNRLCALAQGDVEVTSGTLLETLLDPAIRVGTSTPKADPSGDYAFEMFGRAGEVREGAAATLEQKALQLTGGPESEPAPEGRNQYAWVMDEDSADVFLTYGTNAVLAQRELGSLQIVQLPEELAVDADYGLIVREAAPIEAWRLALFILSPGGQQILADYGFTSGALPAGS